MFGEETGSAVDMKMVNTKKRGSKSRDPSCDPTAELEPHVARLEDKWVKGEQRLDGLDASAVELAKRDEVLMGEMIATLNAHLGSVKEQVRILEAQVESLQEELAVRRRAVTYGGGSVSQPR